ncbi:MAG: RagB/SusD family nutrient uptake outer membrane protein [Bacteroidales bacterium]|nr:RagB/SusD family nutrient uptake outer membrane protein [Bacteroidales bacterium]
MKKNSKYLIYLILLLTAIGCSEDFLELENINQKDASTYYRNADEAEEALNTAYMPMAFSQCFGRDIQYMNYALSDRILHERTSDENLFFNSSTDWVKAVYHGLYIGIFRANLVLENVPGINMDDNQKRRILAEARFLRGLYHFYAATYYEIPPLMKETPKDPKIGATNAVSKQQIYQFAAENFRNAIPDLYSKEEVRDADQLGRATDVAAKAFLGKTYLYMQEWDSAVAYLGELYSSYPDSLVMPPIGSTDSLDWVFAYLCNFAKEDLNGGTTTYKAEYNKESIFEVNFSSVHSAGDFAQFLPGRRSTGSLNTWYFTPYVIKGFANVAMEDKIFPTTYEKPVNHPAGLTRDPRLSATFMFVGEPLDYKGRILGNLQQTDLNAVLESSAALRKGYYPFHADYSYPSAPYNDPNNIRLMRFADVYLMYAEALIRAEGLSDRNAFSSNSTALEAINKVRRRAGLADLTQLSGNDIIHERDVELVGEGYRYWDLVRWYESGWLNLNDVRTYKPTFQPKHVCVPIPDREINLSKGNLKQNPKWTN